MRDRRTGPATKESDMSLDRRTFLASAMALTATTAQARKRTPDTPNGGAFPPGFLWGAATAGHQVEGNNTAADTWFVEHVQPTVFAEPSGDACNSLVLWPQDLDLVRGLGLNTYRFSVEWARIEPEQGQFSNAMLDHYARMIDGCRERGLTPMVTFNHFTCPRWFAVAGGWLNPQAPGLFARYCERASRHLAAHIGYATTLNEPNLNFLLKWFGLPQRVWDGQRATLAAARRASDSDVFSMANVANSEDLDRMQTTLLAAHKVARAAIKSVGPDLPVGVSIAISDDQAVGSNSKVDAKRAETYAAWLDLARGDEFMGVQNYDRTRIDANGTVRPAPDVPLNSMGNEIYPPSLGNAVRYAHSKTGKPIIVTEHGLGTSDDSQRAAFIPAALRGLKAAMNEGIPVLGYVHWSLLDNFEWIFGYKPRFGLFEVDRQTFKRTAKPSAAVYAAIARRNAL
jgi:beta-glucosidase